MTPAPTGSPTSSHGRPVFEVDLAPISRAKAATIARHVDEFPEANVVRVEIDFETQALTDVLADAGFTRRRADVLHLGGRRRCT